MAEGVQTNNDKARYSVTLVHGTFAKAAWTDPGAPLSVALKAGGDVVISLFNWSGGNTHAARLEAAKSLQAHLHKTYEADPGRKQVVIAHSHGGNVALYALKDIRFDVSIATLGCPFVLTEPRALGLAFFMLEHASMMMMLLGIPIVGGMASIGIEAAISYAGLTVPSFVPLLPLLVTIVSLAILFYRWLRGCEVPGWMVPKRTLDRLRTHQSQSVGLLRVSHPAERPALFVGVTLDEARWTLTAVNQFSNIPWAIADGAARIGVGLMVFLFIFGLPLGLFTLGGVIPVLVCVLFLPIVSLSVVRRLAYWDDSFLTTILVRLSASPLPQLIWSPASREDWKDRYGRRPMLAHYPVTSWRALRHSSMCGDERIVRDVVEWVFRGVEPDHSEPIAPPAPKRAPVLPRVRERGYWRIE